MGWRRITSRERDEARYELRRVGGATTLTVVRHDGQVDEYRADELVLVRRVRDLELDLDSWHFFFRSGRSVVSPGLGGRNLARRLRRAAPAARHDVHHPDAD